MGTYDDHGNRYDEGSHRVTNRAGHHGVPVGRCRCGGQITEDGKGCEWHTAVQAEALRDVLAAVSVSRVWTLRRYLRAILTAARG